MEGEGMKLKNNKLKISVLLIATLVGTLGIYSIWANVDPKSTGLADDKQGFSLVRPAFAQSMAAATSFLDQEAGMAIYMNISGTINLDTAKNQMVYHLENVTSDYVIGSLDIGLGSDEYPHCYVDKSGWFVVYYLKVNTQSANNPATTGWLGKIINWNSPNNDQVMNNKLHKGLEKICQPFTSDLSAAKYYHFQHPNATKLMIAIKNAPNNGQTVTFNIKVPGTLTIYERSWSCISGRQGTFTIDGNIISPSGMGWRYGGPEITEAILYPDAFHTVTLSLYNSVYGNSGNVCLLILYS
jgi:hypothetical protein